LKGKAGAHQAELFVDDKDAIVGYAVHQFQKDIYDPHKVVVYLRQFYIERERRSKGLGSRAVKMLAQTRFPTDCTIEAEVLASNPRGAKFWSQVGFRPYCMTMKLENKEFA
jgi:GNAT superfamily N-acetyltransferase